MKTKHFTPIALLCWVYVTATWQAQGASFQGLGDLPGGRFMSSATGVSDDGLTVVGYSVSGPDYNQDEAFVWTPREGMVGIGYLEGTLRSGASAVSGDGAAVVGFSTRGSATLAFRWTMESGMVSLGSFATGSNPESVASGISPDGAVVVGSSALPARDDDQWEAFRWTAETGLAGLGFVPGDNSNYAYDLSHDARVVVGYSRGGSYSLGYHTEAFRWTAESGMVGLGRLPNAQYPSSGAYGVSGDGSVVVGYSNAADGDSMAFRWSEETGMLPLGRLPGTERSLATDVSGDGSTVVGYSELPFSSGRERRAFIWDAENRMRNLQDVLSDDYALSLADWTLWFASGISDDGRVIVGYGINPQGNTEAFRAVIPEPTSLTLLTALAAASLLGHACRRQKGC